MLLLEIEKNCKIAFCSATFKNFADRKLIQKHRSRKTSKKLRNSFLLGITKIPFWQKSQDCSFTVVVADPELTNR